jgi:hypothetical protein
MHYLFLDESYVDHCDRREILVAAWAVDQGRLNNRGERLNEIFHTPVEEHISSTLEDLDALALVANAVLQKSLFRTGEIDGTDDIPAMARADNIWSQSVLFTVGTLVLEHWRTGRPLDAIDIYFDPKSLRREHAEALTKALRKLVTSEAKRFDRERARNLLRKLNIRRFQPVDKATGDRPPDKFQIGTWIADKLCSYRKQGTLPMASRIKTFDMSEEIRRTVQQWDGRSFNDG